MRWRFKLIDRFNNATEINEPSGWAEFAFKLKRHPERHGTFREIQTNEFVFYGKAAEMLRSEYENQGANGKYTLQIEEKCGSADFELQYNGDIDFTTYQYSCGVDCSVTCEVEQRSALLDFINRFDQKVDLDDSKAFDKLTNLASYDKLGKIITLPSKSLILGGNAKCSGTFDYVISDDIGWFPASPTGSLGGSICPIFDTIEVNSIDTFSPQTVLDYFNYSNEKAYTPEIILNNPDQDLNCVGKTFNVNFRVKGVYKNLVSGAGSQSLTLNLKKGKDTFNTNVINIASWTVASTNNNAASFPFDVIYSGSITLEPGEKLWLAFFLQYIKTNNYSEDVRIEVHPESFFKSKVLSLCDPTPAKVYFINEVLSRVTESVTNNQLRVISDQYGRTDSQPFSSIANGCGSLKCITNGLQIRRSKLTNGQDPKILLSMKDLFGSLSAIDNIGIGMEGEDKIRVEYWTWFYQSNTMLSADKVQRIDKKILAEEHYSVFKTGYEKWEAEDYNGLDEFLTKRSYRTSLSSVQNTLERLSKFIASGYAIEITRRKGVDTKDWRYDNDIFVICLVQDGLQYVVEVGVTASSINIEDPITTYNYRISPARNAMKWFSKIMAPFKGTTEKLIFNEGDGNYIAAGQLNSAHCNWDGGVISESQDISMADFADDQDAAPILRPERVSFDYPLSMSDFKRIKALPYGLINYSNDCERGSGWIDELEYTPNTGLAKFTLIPKR